MSNKCLRGFCDAPAVDHNVKTEGFKRKQYCAAHYEEYKAKQRAYRERSRDMPDCESGCGRKAMRDEPLCQSCSDKVANEIAKDQIWKELRDCDDLDEVKRWLEDYLRIRN